MVVEVVVEVVDELVVEFRSTVHHRISC
jgi:hypothetical protein